MKSFTLILGLLFTALSSFSQNVTIPDVNFKNYLLGNTAVNLNADSEIQLTEAQGFSGALYCGNINITDASGIEAFTNLTTLVIPMNQLISLDVSQNLALEVLICPMNQLASLDVTQNVNLKELVFNDNYVSSIDVSNCPLLTRLEFSNNAISTIDLSSNPLLEILEISGTSISLLDLSIVPLLKTLKCNGTNISSLDLTQIPNLTYFECMIVAVFVLDFSQNLNLEYARVDFTNVNHLDLSANHALNYFGCFSCTNLYTLNLANGNNINMAGIQANNNPQLYCILVDDVTYSVNNWLQVDTTSVFKTDCQASIEAFTETVVQVYPQPFQTIFSIEFPETISLDEITIVNSLGERVFKQQFTSENQYQNIDASHLSSGVYFLTLRIKDSEEILVKKLVKE